MARPSRKFWVEDVWLIACVLWLVLTFYWLFAFGGPVAALCDLEAKWTGGRMDPPLMTMFVLLCGAFAFTWAGKLVGRFWPAGPDEAQPTMAAEHDAPATTGEASAEAVVHHATPAGHKRQHNKGDTEKKPASAPPHPRSATHSSTTRRSIRSGERSGWYIGMVVGAIGTMIMLALAGWDAGVALTRGDLTRITAAEMERGTKPKSGWVEVSGVPAMREAIDVSGQYKAHHWSQTYVPLLGEARELPADAEVFLCVDDGHRRGFSSKAASFRGTVSIQTLPNEVWHDFEKRGLHPGRHNVVINFGESPAELMGEAKEVLRVAGVLGVVTLVMGVIAWVRTARMRHR